MVVAAQQLERDLAAELDVLGAIHVPHAAFSEQLGHAIAAEHRVHVALGIVGAVAGDRCGMRGGRWGRGLAAAVGRRDACDLAVVGSEREGRRRWRSGLEVQRLRRLAHTLTYRGAGPGIGA